MIRIAAGLLALLAAACEADDTAPVQPAREKPSLALLTSLPIGFGEGFTLDAAPHPVMQRLEQDFAVTLIDGPEQLPAGGLLLAIQPQALTAERLVALDAWVRAGGRILLLADPRLSWESERPLGDRLRPPYAFSDTGLLGHWGLGLDAPRPDESDPVLRQLGGREILTAAPGQLAVIARRGCAVSASGLIARCRLGQGQAVVVADADFVQAGQPGGLDGPTGANLDALAAELNALAH